MKKHLLSAVLVLFATGLMAQITAGDVEIFQKYFGTEKASMVKEYMALTPQQDTAFWPVYNKYETERQAMGKQKIAMIKEYMNNVQDISEQKAKEMVDKGIAMEMRFKTLQKKYFTEMSKKVGPVKAAQFYQFENYINNVINLSIQENIPFIGDLSQKYGASHGKKK
jgi:ribosomal protein L7/L12